jgi:hypothetical protein
MIKQQIHVGVARAIITPPTGIYLVGYADRVKGNQGVHDELSATALVLDDGKKKIAIVACDLLCINEEIVDHVRAHFNGRSEVIICCSHTHSGPIGYAGKGKQRIAYMRFLKKQIIKAVETAIAKSQPARLFWSQTEANIAVNRREKQADGSMEIGVNPDGIVDRQVNILSVESMASERLATLVNFACHGTVLGPDNLLVSADWIGAMREQVENKLGGLTLFIQGAAGNLNPKMGWGKEDVWDMVSTQGVEVGQAVIAGCQERVEINASPIRSIQEEAWIHFNVPVKSEKMPPSYRKRLLKMIDLLEWLSFITDPLLAQRYPWKSRVGKHEGFWATPLRLNTLCIGELALVSFGAETFTEIGLEIKKSSPFPYTLFASITDGCIGYLPTSKAQTEGGYEVEIAPYSYRYPGQIAVGSDRQMVERALENLEKLRD